MKRKYNWLIILLGLLLSCFIICCGIYWYFIKSLNNLFDAFTLDEE